MLKEFSTDKFLIIKVRSLVYFIFKQISDVSDLLSICFVSLYVCLIEVI